MPDYRLTAHTELAILSARRRDNPVAFAREAIDRLNQRRTGRASCDSWIDYAIGQWREFLRESAA